MRNLFQSLSKEIIEFSSSNHHIWLRIEPKSSSAYVGGSFGHFDADLHFDLASFIALGPLNVRKWKDLA